MHAHLSDDLHIVVEVSGPFSDYKLQAGIAEVRKMLIPNVSCDSLFDITLSIYRNLLVPSNFHSNFSE